MEQLSRKSDVAGQDAQIKCSKEECASSMEQRPKDAACKDVQMEL